MIAAQCERRVRNIDAAVVDAAVAFAGDAVLESEFEVLGGAGPDEEGVAFDFVAGGDFADGTIGRWLEAIRRFGFAVMTLRQAS